MNLNIYNFYYISRGPINLLNIASIINLIIKSSIFFTSQNQPPSDKNYYKYPNKKNS